MHTASVFSPNPYFDKQLSEYKEILSPALLGVQDLYNALQSGWSDPPIRLQGILDDIIDTYANHPDAEALGTILEVHWKKGRREQHLVQALCRYISPEQTSRSELVHRMLWRVIDIGPTPTLQLLSDQLQLLKEAAAFEVPRKQNQLLLIAMLLARGPEHLWLAEAFQHDNDQAYRTLMLDLGDQLYRPAASVPNLSVGFSNKLLTVLDNIPGRGLNTHDYLRLIQPRLTFAMVVFYLLQVSSALDAMGLDRINKPGSQTKFSDHAGLFRTCARQLIRWKLHP